MNKLLSFFILAITFFIHSNIQAQFTSIPDANFEQQLILQGIDSDGLVNGQMLTVDAIGVTNLHITNVSVADLTGIEIFTDLDTLNCYNNNITNLDLSNNTGIEFFVCSKNPLGNSLNTTLSQLPNLTYLACAQNNLSYLDLSNNPTLEYVYCRKNQLSSINLSNNSNLKSLECQENQLLNLNISNNINLEHFDCYSNNLTSLDVSNNLDLEYLNCSHNTLTGIDVSNNINLEFLGCVSIQTNNLDVSNNPNLDLLSCGYNQITSLDVSNNLALTQLYCGFNQLTTLDVSVHDSLESFVCNSNQLSSLFLSNTVPNLSYFLCDNNNLIQLNLMGISTTNLSSIFMNGNQTNMTICAHPTAVYLNQNSWVKDPSAYYSQDCSLPITLTGQIAIDTNANCQVDSNEMAALPTNLTISNGNTTLYTSNYGLLDYYSTPDTGTHIINAFPPNPAWTVCPPSQTVTIDTSYTLQTADFVLQPANMPCTWLTAEMSTPFVRLTTNGSHYTVSYCNEGSVEATNAYIEVELDPNLIVLGTSIPISSQNGNIYTFNLDTIGVAECDHFTIHIQANPSNAIVGQSICSEVRILPITPCITDIWTDAIITVDANCLNDSIEFILTNVGTNLLQPVTYQVYEDNIIFRPIDSTGLLANGQTQTITIPADSGRMYRIEVSQLANFPSVLGDSIIMASIEGCLPNPNGSFNLGLINALYNGNSAPYVDVECNAIIGSYDPNDKSAQPEGYGPNHYIYDDTPLEYRVRFQNTGNDTALNIFILDTISPNLDITTLQMGVSSHNYTWQVTNNVLRVDFNNIYLPDSTTDELASNGYFKYSIQQKPNNPIGTMIYNQAAIYFDYNPPIFTNTTFHEIGEDFIPIEIEVISEVNDLKNEATKFHIYPNPTQQSVFIQNEDAAATQIQVYDALGRLLLTDYTEGNLHEIDLSQFDKGIYWLILHNDFKTQNFKLIKQ